MPYTGQTTDHAGGVVVFARGDTCCAACAPTDLRKVAVETEVCRLEPRGSILSWRAISGPIANGPNPRPCPHRAGRVHWLLARELRR
jgi:hypothetical protein